MSIGIIVATEYELTQTKKLLSNIKEYNHYNLTFYSGNIENKNVVIVKCGIGKVNAARTTQVLIDKFKIDFIINLGAAGALNPDLNVKDIVIGEKLVQYDFDLSELDNVKKGEIQGIGRYIRSDEKLIKICKKALSKICDSDFNYILGTIGTADFFCADSSKAIEIREEFNIDCVEMEGCAIAQVCLLDKVPFIIIRGISDTQNENNKIDYYTYCEAASEQAANLIKEFIACLTK